MTSMNVTVDVATRSLADILRGLAASGASTFGNFTVASVTTAGAADGGDIVMINVGSEVIRAPYLGASPPAGSTVRVEFCDGSPLIHGRVLGKTA